MVLELLVAGCRRLYGLIGRVFEPMAQPMLNSASEPRKRAGLSVPVITMVLSVMDANTCSVDCAAIHARISLDKVLCAPVFRPCLPFAVPAKRSGLTQACGHSSQ